MSMGCQKNDIIDYYDSRKISCGLVLEVDERRLRILTDQGKETKISQSRALTAARDPLFPLSGSRVEQVGRLKEISGQREQIKSSIDLQEVWDVLGNETREIGIQDLSELVFGGRQDANAAPSLVRAIFEDRLYFKIRPEGIEVLPPERVEQAIAQREKERERSFFIAAAAEFLTRLKARGKDHSGPVPEGLIPMLEEAAELGRDWVTCKGVKEIFGQAGLPQDWDPFRVLVTIGVWSEDENVRLRAEKIPIEFSPPAESLARHAAETPLPTLAEDLSHLEPVTIDAVTTRDVDDALSLTRNGENCIVGIHIADCAHFVEPDSPFDLEIRERATSIYLPELMIPMIPQVLSEGAASLAVGVDRPAVSVLAQFDPSCKLKDYRIVSSTIRVKQRLSYEEADERISDPDSPEARMFVLASAFRKDRVDGGAIIFKDPEVSVRVQEDGSIEVHKRDRETPSQILVSEMMILANSLFAHFLIKKGIPGIFRSQPPPLERIELGEEYDPVVSYQSKKLLSRGDLSTVPAAHSTLGLAAYTTATSPLRRYTDLLVQRQIKAALNGSTPVSQEETLQKILSEISYRLERATQLERDRRRYFLLRYLEKRKRDEFESVVLQRFPRFYLVRISELGINAALSSTGGLSLSPGERALVRIEKLNPRDDKLGLSLVRLL